MAIGQPTRAQLDSYLSDAVRTVEQAFSRLTELTAWFTDRTDPDLVAIGYTAVEIADIRAALLDMRDLGRLRMGTSTLGVAKDFRTSTRKLHGPVL